MAFLYSQRRRLPVRTNSADASAHEIDDLASLAQEDFRRHFFLGGAAQNTDRNVSDASAEGSRVDAPQNPRLIDSDGTWLGHTGCHRAVQKRLGQLSTSMLWLQTIWQNCHMAAAKMVQ